MEESTTARPRQHFVKIGQIRPDYQGAERMRSSAFGSVSKVKINNATRHQTSAVIKELTQRVTHEFMLSVMPHVIDGIDAKLI